MKIQFDSLLQWQVDKVYSEGALTQRQKDIFKLLLEGRYLDVGIAWELGMSIRTYYRHKKRLKEKVVKVLFSGS